MWIVTPLPPMAPATPSLPIFDLNGRTVRVLHNGPLAAGGHRIIWDGKGHTSTTIASGVYVARLPLPAEAAAHPDGQAPEINQPFLGNPVFLAAAAGFVRNAHGNQPPAHQFVKGIPEIPRPGGVPRRFQQIPSGSRDFCAF